TVIGDGCQIMIDSNAKLRSIQMPFCTQVLLAWVISHQGVMAIPKAATIAHVQQNAAALEVELSSAELAMLDKAYPAPKGKTALDMV
ncbi:aldo/keto reductase, partial [Escherichia coli]|uniref:aldo/keto reductase n=1 Tax=Escherichia coli TaxID=562 RepID=UPI003CE7AC8F